MADFDRPGGADAARSKIDGEAAAKFKIEAANKDEMPTPKPGAPMTKDEAYRFAMAEAARKKSDDTQAKSNITAHMKEEIPAPKAEAPRPAAPVSPSFAGRVAGELKTVKVGNLDVVLCWCPPGSFTMGSPKSEADRKDVEGPVEVRLTKGFWVMRTEMTQELYEALIGRNPSQFKGPKLPVEMVDYNEAVECAVKLTKALRGAGPLPVGWEVRLPTEAQWEYAARAGTKTATPFGDRLDSKLANFDGNHPYGGAAKGPYLEKTEVVGSYGPNAWGLVDTVGNVLEWTMDRYDAELPGDSDPFVWQAEGSYRVFRGGCWDATGRFCRSACRNGGGHLFRRSSLGFRLVAVQSVD